MLLRGACSFRQEDEISLRAAEKDYLTFWIRGTSPDGEYWQDVACVLPCGKVFLG